MSQQNELPRWPGSARSYDSTVTEVPGVTTVQPPERLLRACHLPALIADDDGRGRVVALRQFVKDWAASDDVRRRRMVADAPLRHRPWHRLGPRRFDLARIAAVVDGLCERDNLSPPAWVASHRADRPVSLTQQRLAPTKWNAWVRSVAPPACERHNVWFVPTALDDYRVHGFR